MLALVGLAVEELVIRHVYRRFIDSNSRHLGHFAGSLKQAVIIAFGPTAQSIVSPIPGPVQILGVTYPAYRLFIMGFAVILTGATFLFFYRTHIGLAVPGVIANRAMAASLGINTRLLYCSTFAIGAALAGVAGAVMAPIMSVDPQMGVGFLIPAFLSILVGGPGTLLGALVGTAAISGATTIVSDAWTQVAAQVVVFTMAIVVIRVFPQGIMGRRSSDAREVFQFAADSNHLDSPGLGPLFLANEWNLAQLGQYMTYGIFAMGVAFIWGQAGILSFGQAIFFGIGGYCMALVNLGQLPFLGDSTTVGLLLALVLSSCGAYALGRPLFHGRRFGWGLLCHCNALCGGDRRDTRAAVVFHRRL